MNLIRSCALLSLLLVSPLQAAELYDDKKVARIIVVSEDGSEAEAAEAKLKTKTGDPFSQTTFDGDLKTLSGEYDRVTPQVELRGGEVYITVRVAPKPIIHEVIWQGNYQFGSSTLQEELNIKAGDVFDRQSFNKAFNKVKEYYFKKGYFESQMTYHLEPIEGTNEVNVIIDVQEGRPGHIKKITLTGFSSDEESDIEEQMYLQKYNFLYSWLTGTGIYRDEALEQDRMTILNYLQNKGYADAKVDIKLTDDPESGKLLIDITADRGELYHVGVVQFTGNSLLSNEEIEKKLSIKSGDIYSPEKLRDAVQAVKNLYGQKGYIDASVQYETVLLENSPTFNVDFIIEEGSQYKVGMIHIFGNTTTKSNVILRESLLVPGETFDSRKLQATQQRLEAIGYFKSVNVYAVRSGDDEALGPSYRDVYIEVEETTTGNVSLFAGFSSMDNVFGGIDLTERNFNLRGLGSSFKGGGEYLHIRGTAGRLENNILVSWMNPYVNDSLWRLGVELSRTFSELQRDMTVSTYGGSVYTSYPINTYWTAGMRQRIRHSKDNLELSPVDDSQIAQDSVGYMKEQLNQNGLISAFSGNLSYDSTDSSYRPHRGWRSYFEAEVAGVGGQYTFFKTSYTNSIYFPISKRTTLKLRGDFKYILPFGSTTKETVPYSERFFLGGETTVRGYKPFMLGPVVELLNSAGDVVQTGTPYGGLSSSLLSLEYNVPIFKMLDIFTFVDAGSVTFDKWDIDHIRCTVGAGARIDIGNRNPIMFGYGIPVDKKDRTEEKWQRWFFSLGAQF